MQPVALQPVRSGQDGLSWDVHKKDLEFSGATAVGLPRCLCLCFCLCGCRCRCRCRCHPVLLFRAELLCSSVPRSGWFVRLAAAVCPHVPPHRGQPPRSSPVVQLAASLCAPAPPLCAVTSAGLADWLSPRPSLCKSLSYLISRVSVSEAVGVIWAAGQGSVWSHSPSLGERGGDPG